VARPSHRRRLAADQVNTGIAAAEAALRYNIRPLLARRPRSLRGAVLELGGDAALAVASCDEAVALEGLTPDQAPGGRRQDGHRAR
jgi:hypothetical protein